MEVEEKGMTMTTYHAMKKSRARKESLLQLGVRQSLSDRSIVKEALNEEPLSFEGEEGEAVEEEEEGLESGGEGGERCCRRKVRLRSIRGRTTTEGFGGLSDVVYRSYNKKEEIMMGGRGRWRWGGRKKPEAETEGGEKEGGTLRIVEAT